MRFGDADWCFAVCGCIESVRSVAYSQEKRDAVAIGL